MSLPKQRPSQGSSWQSPTEETLTSSTISRPDLETKAVDFFSFYQNKVGFSKKFIKMHTTYRFFFCTKIDFSVNFTFPELQKFPQVILLLIQQARK